MDDLTYNYQINMSPLPDMPNRLLSVFDEANVMDFSEDFNGHTTTDNYAYDRIGNLIRDTREFIEVIDWNVYGKVDRVKFTDAGVLNGREHVYYKYDAAGNRLERKVEPGNRTHYVRDASGNIMAVYHFSPQSQEIQQSEVPLYGSSRLGQRMFFDRIVSEEEPDIPDPKRVRGEKVYELSNHLGNVLVTISDQKLGEDGPDQDVFADYYLTNTLNATDYYPFGQAMPQRTQIASAYRYGFNGKEYDKGWTANVIPVLDYGFRIYNPAIGRFLRVDPLADSYAPYSPYNYCLNNPVLLIDPDGRAPEDIIIRGSEGNTFNWTVGSTYDGDDEFIHQAVDALDALGADSNTANFSFKGKKDSGVNFEGNAVLDYAKGGSKDHQDVFIEHADNNPAAPGENQHITGTVYWNPSYGIAEEGFNGAEGSGAFPSMGLLIHEMGHAALYNEFGGADWQDRQHIFANEEQMIIDRLEKPAMQSLGFGYRTGHNTYDSRSDLLNTGYQGHQATGRPFRGSYLIPSLTPTKLKK